MPLIHQPSPEKFNDFCVALMEIFEPRGEHDYMYSDKSFENAANWFIKAQEGKPETKVLQLMMADEYESQGQELLNKIA